MSARERPVVVVGAGVGGLSAALRLSASGRSVTVLERAATPGGKMRRVEVAGEHLDAGPTVFTLRGVFDDLFAAAGTSLEAELPLTRIEVLARHAWPDGSRLDLFADPRRSAAAIEAFAGAREAAGFERFAADAKRAFSGLERSFMQAQRAGMATFAARVGPRGLLTLAAASPLRSLWSALGRYFRDPRLRQLFGRYSTYCGSDPFRAPATLMLIAHAELAGVWSVDGGMYRLAETLARLAEARGTCLRYGAEVARVETRNGRACGVTLERGERIDASHVIVTADAGAVGAGVLGEAAAGAVRSPPSPTQRSLSALTFSVVAEASGFPLVRHNVFFSADYRAEFADLGTKRRLPSDPTVYVCAQDRDDTGTAPGARDRLLCLVNAPALGDAGPNAASLTDEEIQRCQSRTFDQLSRAGLHLRWPATCPPLVTTPRHFEALFPMTGGALYGPATHGPTASFARQGARTRVPGLYMAGGSAHPSAGVPMAATSARLAVEALLHDAEPGSSHGLRSPSTSASTRTAISGGTSMP